MRNQRVTFSVVIAFLAGCAAARAVTVPPAHADGPAVTRWEYTCTNVKEFSSPEDLSVALTAFGKEGWELSVSERVRFCFKRHL